MKRITALLKKCKNGEDERDHRLRVEEWLRSAIDIDIDYLANIILFVSIFIGIWYLLYLLEVWPHYLLPSPIQVVLRLIRLVADGVLIYGISITLLRLIVGFIIAVVIGIALGLAMVTFKEFGKVMNSICLGLLSFPSIAWIPFSILLIGFNDYGILFVIVMSSLFSMAMATYSGIRNIPPIYIKAARNMGSRGISLFKYVMIPAATPSLIAGIRQVWSFAWHAAIGAEMLMATIGLGAILMFGREFQNMEQVIASMITIFVVGLLTDRLLFVKLEERIRYRWGLQHN